MNASVLLFPGVIWMPHSNTWGCHPPLSDIVLPQRCILPKGCDVVLLTTWAAGDCHVCRPSKVIHYHAVKEKVGYTLLFCVVHILRNMKNTNVW